MQEERSSITLLPIIVTSICALLSLFVLLFALIDFPRSQGGVPGPRVFPMLVSAIMFMSAIYVLLKSISKKHKAHNKHNNTDGIVRGSVFRLSFFKFIALIIIYSIFVVYVGFFVSTVLFLFLLIRKYTSYTWYGIVGLSVFITVLLYFVFNVLLNVPLDIVWGIGG